MYVIRLILWFATPIAVLPHSYLTNVASSMCFFVDVWFFSGAVVEADECHSNKLHQTFAPPYLRCRFHNQQYEVFLREANYSFITSRENGQECISNVTLQRVHQGRIAELVKSCQDCANILLSTILDICPKNISMVNRSGSNRGSISAWLLCTFRCFSFSTWWDCDAQHCPIELHNYYYDDNWKVVFVVYRNIYASSKKKVVNFSLSDILNVKINNEILSHSCFWHIFGYIYFYYPFDAYTDESEGSRFRFPLYPILELLISLQNVQHVWSACKNFPRCEK